jgi:N-methyl-L-proline demethylase
VERQDGRLRAELRNEYGGASVYRTVDQVVVEHGTLPQADLYFALRDGSSNAGEVDQQALMELRAQEVGRNPEGTYQLFRIGDAVSSRNVHAAIFDAFRLCLCL